MAVLVEANTLIVRRRFLHHHYPGSTRQFLRDARQAGKDVRYAIADRDLAAVSSSDTAPMARLAQRLEELGATGRDFVRMDGKNGPDAPVSWLSWHTDDLGVTGARLDPDGSRQLTTPEGWAPADTLDALYEEFLENPERFVALGTRDGIGFWLDVETGREVRGIVPTWFKVNTASANDLNDIAVEVLRRRGLEFDRAAGGDPISLTLKDDQGREFPLWIHSDEEPRCLHVLLGIQSRVPPQRRTAVADYLSRANWDLWCGHLEVDWSDGEVRFHHSVLMADGTLTPAMVETLIDLAFQSVQRFLDGLEQVIGGADPERAYSEARNR